MDEYGVLITAHTGECTLPATATTVDLNHTGNHYGGHGGVTPRWTATTNVDGDGRRTHMSAPHSYHTSSSSSSTFSCAPSFGHFSPAGSGRNANIFEILEKITADSYKETLDELSGSGAF